MADLTAEQKQAVSQWAEEGSTLNDIQTRLKTEFGVSLTYMETRLLVTELEVRLKDRTIKPEPKLAVQPAPETNVEDEVEEDLEDVNAPMEDAVIEEEGEGSAFSIETDELVVPGALVSGTANFSDGVKAKWYLDQTGRLSLKADPPDYQPPQVDVPKFQQGLEKILVKLGMY